MDFETQRKKRLQALDEKRKRVEEMRKRRGSVEVEQPSSGALAPASAPAETDGDLDNLIESLLAEKESPPAARAKTLPADVESAPISATSTPSVAKESSPTPMINALHKASASSKLSVVRGIAQVQVMPRVIETYNKEMQTEGDQQYDEDSNPKLPSPPVHRRKTSRTYNTAHSVSTRGLHLDEVLVEERPRSSSTPLREEQPEVKPVLTKEQKNEIMADPEFLKFLNHSSLIAERALGRTETYSIFVDYSTALDARDSINGDSDKISRTLKFQNEKLFEGRPVMDVEWCPHYGELFLGAYGQRSRRGGLQMGGSHLDADVEGMLAVWSVHLDRPEYTFTASSSVLTAHFHKFDTHLIIGGTYSGQILLWDLRTKSFPVQWTSLAAGGHTHPVYSMDMIGTSGAYELVSASTDGKLCHWDVARLQEPLTVRDLAMDVSNVSSSETSDSSNDHRKPVFVSCFAFGQGESSRHLVLGSESGKLYSTYVPQRQNEVIREYDAHFGVTTSLHFHQGHNRMLKDLLLSSSVDWTVKLWNLNVSNKPLMSFQQPSYEYICDVKWSPIHAALFSTINSSGELALWNLNQSLQEPVVPGFVVSDASGTQHPALTRMVWSADGRRTLIGDVGGNIHLLTIADELARPRGDEETKLEYVFASENIPLRPPVDAPLQHSVL